MNLNSSSSDSKKNKETLGDLRKQKKRIEESRDALKEKNRIKQQRIKAQLGKVDDLKKSRDLWQNTSENYAKEIDRLKKSLEEERNKRLEKEAWIQEQESTLAQHIQTSRKQQIEYETNIEELKKKLKK